VISPWQPSAHEREVAAAAGFRGARHIAAWRDTSRVTDNGSPRTPPVLATSITSTIVSLNSVHPDFTDASLEFGAGDRLGCKLIRLAGIRRGGR
jgi:hypothetical protein